jgi:hypothetical protein
MPSLAGTHRPRDFRGIDAGWPSASTAEEVAALAIEPPRLTHWSAEWQVTSVEADPPAPNRRRFTDDVCLLTFSGVANILVRYWCD